MNLRSLAVANFLLKSVKSHHVRCEKELVRVVSQNYRTRGQDVPARNFAPKTYRRSGKELQNDLAYSSRRQVDPP